MPALPGAKEAPLWGYVNVIDDYLIGGGDPSFDPKLAPMVLKGGDDDDRRMAESKEKADRGRSFSLLHQLARHIVDRSNMVRIDRMTQSQAISEHGRPQKNRLVHERSDSPYPCPDIGECEQCINGADAVAKTDQVGFGAIG